MLLAPNEIDTGTIKVRSRAEACGCLDKISTDGVLGRRQLGLTDRRTWEHGEGREATSTLLHPRPCRLSTVLLALVEDSCLDFPFSGQQ